MKLKNKKTGEIGYTAVLQSKDIVVMDENAIQLGSYTSLAELNSEWEDAPEVPKLSYVVDLDGEILPTNFEYKTIEKSKELGNYFETKEEAEKAVKKLKAWHKLMDYWGTEVLGWEIRDMPTGGNWQTVNVKFNVKTRKEPMELLDILFGGEE
jgi:hypothetical protein